MGNDEEGWGRDLIVGSLVIGGFAALVIALLYAIPVEFWM